MVGYGNFGGLMSKRTVSYVESESVIRLHEEGGAFVADYDNVLFSGDPICLATSALPRFLSDDELVKASDDELVTSYICQSAERYFDTSQKISLERSGTPPEGIAFMRKSYVDGAVSSREAMHEILSLYPSYDGLRAIDEAGPITLAPEPVMASGSSDPEAGSIKFSGADGSEMLYLHQNEIRVLGKRLEPTPDNAREVYEGFTRWLAYATSSMPLDIGLQTLAARHEGSREVLEWLSANGHGAIADQYRSRSC